MPIHHSRLLVVDDDTSHRTLVRRQLDDAGYDVHVAGDGAEGLEATRELMPDVVICDWMMPRVDGIEYCRRVKADPTLRSTYVAMLTARDDSTDKVQALDAGADEFLVKPLDGQELLARVRAGIRIRQLQRELLDARHRSALLEMATTLGHEINNPLTALFGHLELVLQYLEKNEPDRMRHHIRQAGELAGRIAEVGHRLVALRDPQMTRYLGDLEMLDLEKVPR